FGTAFVAGRKRVPSPAAGMTALRTTLSARSVRAAELALLGFLQRLAVDAEGGYGARLEALEADALSALLALPVGAVVDPVDRFLDLADQLALPVADAQREVAVRLERRAIGRVREVLLLVHAVDGPVCLGQELGHLLVEELTEQLEIALIHATAFAD